MATQELLDHIHAMRERNLPGHPPLRGGMKCERRTEAVAPVWGFLALMDDLRIHHFSSSLCSVEIRWSLPISVLLPPTFTLPFEGGCYHHSSSPYCPSYCVLSFH